MTTASTPSTRVRVATRFDEPSSAQIYFARPVPNTLQGAQAREAVLLRLANPARHGTIFATHDSGSLSNHWSAPMGEVVRFVPKSELERARLIREARANYERIFPPADHAGERDQPKK
jgi:hypothetical protein